MTKDEILKIKNHIEIHARLEPRAIHVTEILRRAVVELEHIAELEKENAELKNTETMLKILKDRGVIKSWYFNGSYHVGNELPR